MTSKTGTKQNRTGFSLIEVMAAVSILSLATVMISQSNLMSLNVYGRYAARLAIQSWADEKVWEAKEAVLGFDEPEIGETTGRVTRENRIYQWRLKIKESESDEIYTIDLDVSWQEGSRTFRLARHSYALRAERK